MRVRKLARPGRFGQPVLRGASAHRRRVTSQGLVAVERLRRHLSGTHPIATAPWGKSNIISRHRGSFQPRHRHPALGYVSPAEYERRHHPGHTDPTDYPSPETE